MSPEQVLGLRLDGASDVFSLGMLLAELVMGRHPIADAASDFEVLDRIRRLQFPMPETTSGLGAKLRAVLVREPEARSSAAVLGLELARIAETARLRVEPEVIAELVRAAGG